MKKYRVYVHFRYTIGDEQEKDFANYTVWAKTENEAITIGNHLFKSTSSCTRFKTEAKEV